MGRKYLVRTVHTAEHDIVEARDYIARSSPQAACRWVEDVSRAIESLESFPARGAIIPEAEILRQDLRHLVLGQYRLIYRLQRRTVWVLRVVHGARLLDTSLLDIE